MAILDQGLQDLEHALKIDPKYADAMVSMNLLIRYRADLDDTREQWQADIFRAAEWLKKATEQEPQAPGATHQPTMIRQGGTVAQANLITKVSPIYPLEARRARVAGTVRFNVVIGKDGHIETLKLISGHPLLVDAAQNAVKQWVYTPVLLNGQPVKVMTTIDVNFALHQ